MVTNSPTSFEFTGFLSQDLGRPEHKTDPYPFYRWLREDQPIHQGAYGDVIVTRYADTVQVLRDPLFSSSSLNHNEQYKAIRPMLEEQPAIAPLLVLQDKAMLTMDPPDHTRLRRLASKAFSTRAVDALRPRAEQVVAEALDAVEAWGTGEIEVVHDLAYPLPITLICEMLGVPVEDRDLFEEWTPAAIKIIDPSDDFSLMLEAGEAVRHFMDYFRSLIERRRSSPGDDLLTGLIAAEDEGDRLTEDELLATCILLLIAGHETTVNLIGNGLLALLRHPDQLSRLRDDPSLMGSAVEEALRYDAPVQLTARTAVEEREVAGQVITKGQQVVTLLGAANRDPAQFADPDRFDVGRNDRSHMAFGGGIHVCLGAPLARLEARCAFAGVLDRWSSLELVEEEPPRKETVTLRGLSELRLAVSR